MTIRPLLLAVLAPLFAGCVSTPQPATHPTPDALPVSDQAPITLTVGTKEVEVIGLRRWTLPMIQDSLTKYAPGSDLTAHACASILRYKLGFADASSNTLLDGTQRDAAGQPKERVTVVVMEPQDSARVRSRVVPLDTTAPYAPWADLRELVKKQPSAVSLALQLGTRYQPDSMAHVLSNFGGDGAGIRTAWRLQAAHASEADFVAARRLVVESPDMYTRVSAVLVLAGFGRRDESAHALVQAMLESDGYVKGFAGSALSAITRDYPRKVNWSPVVPAVHAVLDGTSLFQFTAMVSALGESQVDSTSATPFLANGGRMLLNYYQSSHASNRQPARRLLIALRGKDLGADVAPWRAWINSL